MSKIKISQEEMSESFDKALEKGEVTDVLGNPIDASEFDDQPVFDRKEWVETDDGSEPEFKKLTFEQIRLIMRGTQGKVLTIVDATFTDEKRLKYVKDLIKDAFSSQANWLFDLCTSDIEPNVEITK